MKLESAGAETGTRTGATLYFYTGLNGVENVHVLEMC